MSGMGIGLYVIKEIVTLHDSTFTVSLPLGMQRNAC